MELDEFKRLVKEKESEKIILHSAGDLEGYIRKRTQSIIGNVKRSIRFELAACLIFIAVAVWVWFTYSVSYIRSLSLLSIFLCCLLLIYLAALYKKINIFEQATLAVKESLHQIIGIIEQFINAYFQFTIITLPIAFVFGLITGFLNIKSIHNIQNFHWQKAIIVYIRWFIFWSVVMYFFSRWYIKKLYGNYLQQLKEQLKEMENG